MDKRFKYVLPDDILRTMNRQQYKATMRWLRFAAWRVNKGINWEKLHKCIMGKVLDSECING